MSKLVDKTPRRHVRKRDAARVVKRMAKNASVTRDRLAVEVTSNQWRVETIMKAAERSGLLKKKSSRIAGRVSPALVEEAKRRTGVEADSDLIAFALNEDLIDVEAKLLGDPHRLAAPVLEYFSDLRCHD